MEFNQKIKFYLYACKLIEAELSCLLQYDWIYDYCNWVSCYDICGHKSKKRALLLWRMMSKAPKRSHSWNAKPQENMYNNKKLSM